jgi:hypothetical protein
VSNSTQQLMDLAAVHQGNVTDYRLHKLSGFAQSTVSKWRVGRAHMGPAAITKFCELAGIKDEMRWQTLIGAERETGPEGDFYRTLRDELTLSMKAGKPVKGGIIDALVRSIAGKAAGILLAASLGLAGVNDARASGNTALSSHSPAEAGGRGMYIMTNRRRGQDRRRRRRILRFSASPSHLASAAA